MKQYFFCPQTKQNMNCYTIDYFRKMRATYENNQNSVSFLDNLAKIYSQGKTSVQLIALLIPLSYIKNCHILNKVIYQIITNRTIVPLNKFYSNLWVCFWLKHTSSQIFLRRNIRNKEIFFVNLHSAFLK